MFLLIVFIFGLIIGSFLNVVIARLGKESLGGRSKCPNCRHQLTWVDLFPVVSFLLLFGKCRHCRRAISWRYPVVELSTGFLFAVNFWLFGVTVPTLINFIILSLLVVIVTYDFLYLLLPIDLVWAVGILGLVYAYLNNYWLESLIAGVVWFLIFWLGSVFSRGLALGMGDASLMAALSLWLGASSSFSLFLIAIWTGALWGITLIVWSRLFKPAELVTMKSKLPFAPFLVFGALLVLFYDFNLWTIFWG